MEYYFLWSYFFAHKYKILLIKQNGKLIYILSFLFFRNTAKIDDDMLSYYCNEDIFLLEVRQIEEDLFDITLTELGDQ